MVGGCERVRGSAATPPAAEFLVAAGDSTFWVESGRDGVRVRSAPILLTQVDGAFYEIFVADDGVDYADAAFSTSRLWGRPVLRGDSLLLFSDSSVAREATAWRRRHPDDLPLEPDDEAMDADPRTTATESIEIVDVHGPYASLTHLVDIDLEDGTPHRHEGRQWVVDVRSGRIVSLETLFGAVEAARVIRDARSALARLADSIRSTTDARGADARETLESFVFDSTSFAITDIGRRPAVAFMIPGRTADGEALALYLPPIETSAPAWWASAGSTLPEWDADSGAVRWTRERYRVLATPSDDGERLALTLATPADGSRQWPIGTVTGPAYGLVTLDSPPVDSTVRQALARAFDANSALDGLTQRVGRMRARTLMAPVRVTRVSRVPRPVR